MNNQDIRNIYAVGRNYSSFAKEMDNTLSQTPIVFLKPTHALESMTGNEITLSGQKGEVNAEAELVLHVGKNYEPGISFFDLVDQITVGIDFTYRETLNEVKKKGQPWLPAKGFISSCTVGEFRQCREEQDLSNDFHLIQNGKVLQVGNVKNMIFSLQSLVEFIAENFGLGAGDLIYTGTPEGIAKLQSGDVLEVRWGEESLGSCVILLK